MANLTAAILAKPLVYAAGRIVAAIMVVLMGATTFYTQRQMIARSGTTDPQQLMVQKLLLYVLPLSFAVSGAFFPIGVLLYWLTTNVWSMGQQAYVIKRMPPVIFTPSGGPARARRAVPAGAPTTRPCSRPPRRPSRPVSRWRSAAAPVRRPRRPWRRQATADRPAAARTSAAAAGDSLGPGRAPCARARPEDTRLRRPVTCDCTPPLTEGPL